MIPILIGLKKSIENFQRRKKENFYDDNGRDGLGRTVAGTGLIVVLIWLLLFVVWLVLFILAIGMPFKCARIQNWPSWVPFVIIVLYFVIPISPLIMLIYGWTVCKEGKSVARFGCR